MYRAAGLAPQGNGIDKVITGGAADNGLVQGTVFIAGVPAIAQIVGKRHQGVELALGKGQAVLIGNGVGGLLALCQSRFQKLGSFLLRDTVGVITGIAAGAVADGVLAVVGIGIGMESLELLDHLHNRIAGGHGAGSRNIHRTDAENTDQHQNGKNRAHNSSHMYTRSFT